MISLLSKQYVTMAYIHHIKLMVNRLKNTLNYIKYII
jgi:hypothetical protein